MDSKQLDSGLNCILVKNVMHNLIKKETYKDIVKHDLAALNHLLGIFNSQGFLFITKLKTIKQLA